MGAVIAPMIVAVHNPKGGVGKTTTAVNLAAVEALSGRRVLLVDLAATSSASISLGARPEHGRPSVAEVLVNPTLVAQAARPVGAVANLDLIPSSLDMARIETTLRHVRQPERRLDDALRPIKGQYDLVVLDVPSSFSLMSHSALITAQHLVVPVAAEYLAIEGLAQYLRWLRDLRRERRGLAKLLGIVLTMVDHRAPATREIVDILRVHNRRGVFLAEIPRDPRAVEAPSHGVPLVSYAKRSRAASAYARLVDEVRSRIKVRRSR
jgi:chromosome partitioning protein